MKNFLKKCNYPVAKYAIKKYYIGSTRMTQSIPIRERILIITQAIRRQTEMQDEKKQERLLTEEQARKYLQKVKQGDLYTLTDRIWVQPSPKKQKPQKQS